MKLVEMINAWNLEAKEIIMNTEQAERKIAEWKASWSLLKSLLEVEGESEHSHEVIENIFCTAIDLSAAGYRMNEDETGWYHPGEGN